MKKKAIENVTAEVKVNESKKGEKEMEKKMSREEVITNVNEKVNTANKGEETMNKKNNVKTNINIENVLDYAIQVICKEKGKEIDERYMGCEENKKLFIKKLLNSSFCPTEKQFIAMFKTAEEKGVEIEWKKLINKEAGQNYINELLKQKATEKQLELIELLEKRIGCKPIDGEYTTKLASERIELLNNFVLANPDKVKPTESQLEFIEKLQFLPEVITTNGTLSDEEKSNLTFETASEYIAKFKKAYDQWLDYCATKGQVYYIERLYKGLNGVAPDKGWVCMLTKTQASEYIQQLSKELARKPETSLEPVYTPSEREKLNELTKFMDDEEKTDFINKWNKARYIRTLLINTNNDIDVDRINDIVTDEKKFKEIEFELLAEIFEQEGLKSVNKILFKLTEYSQLEQNMLIKEIKKTSSNGTLKDREPNIDIVF